MTSSEVAPQHPQQDYAQQQQQQQLEQPLSVNCSNSKTPEPKVTTRSDQTPVACPICTSTFLNGTHFLRHAADKHFVERLKHDLPQVAPFKCPYCSTACKGQLISEWLFDVLNFPKKQRKNAKIWLIYALESKKWLIHRDKDTLHIMLNSH